MSNIALKTENLKQMRWGHLTLRSTTRCTTGATNKGTDSKSEGLYLYHFPLKYCRVTMLPKLMKNEKNA
jgi:hypothetical protein